MTPCYLRLKPSLSWNTSILFCSELSMFRFCSIISDYFKKNQKFKGMWTIFGVSLFRKSTTLQQVFLMHVRSTSGFPVLWCANVAMVTYWHIIHSKMNSKQLPQNIWQFIHVLGTRYIVWLHILFVISLSGMFFVLVAKRMSSKAWKNINSSELLASHWQSFVVIYVLTWRKTLCLQESKRPCHSEIL